MGDYNSKKKPLCGVTPAMVEAGVSAFEIFGDSPPRFLVEQVLQAALDAAFQGSESCFDNGAKAPAPST